MLAIQMTKNRINFRTQMRKPVKVEDQNLPFFPKIFRIIFFSFGWAVKFGLGVLQDVGLHFGP